MTRVRAFDVHAFLFALVCLVAQSRAFFRMTCTSPVTYARADPITSIGKVSTHLHQVVGSNGFDFTVSYDGLRKSSCSTCQPKADKSAYWTPSLFYQAPNGSFHRVNQIGGATVYYLQRPEYAGQRLKAFPAGFRMLAGDMSLRSFNNNSLSQRAVTHHCLDYSGTGAEGEWNYLPKHNCPNGVRTQVFFPSCWDGKRLDSPDNRAHMAYPDGVDSGKCPKSHPVKLVSLFYEIIWDTALFKNMWHDPNGTGQPFVLSNGDPTGYAFHGDFFSGWDVDTLQRAVDQCTNISGNMQDCPVLQLRTDEEMNNCIIPPRTLDETEGWLKRLPGCNAITKGPSAARVQSGCGAPETIISREKATFLSPVSNWTSVGCARDDLSSRAMPYSFASNDMTVNKCVAHCASKGYNYAGLEWGQECWCSSKFESSRIGQYPCTMACAGNSGQRCGAAGRLAVYKKGGGSSTSTPAPTPNTAKYIRPTDSDHNFAAPGREGWYAVGCFKDPVSPRALRGESWLNQGSMTPKACANHCANLGFNYAGVEYGKECHCGNELYGSSKIAASQCSTKCAGNASQKCGGNSALAVYRKSSKAKRHDHSSHFFGRNH